LVAFVMARPLVSPGMVVKTLGVTPQAARRIIGERYCQVFEAGRVPLRGGYFTSPFQRCARPTGRMRQSVHGGMKWR
jgi:hypothetical protein